MTSEKEEGSCESGGGRGEAEGGGGRESGREAASLLAASAAGGGFQSPIPTGSRPATRRIYTVTVLPHTSPTSGVGSTPRRGGRVLAVGGVAAMATVVAAVAAATNQWASYETHADLSPTGLVRLVGHAAAATAAAADPPAESGAGVTDSHGGTAPHLVVAPAAEGASVSHELVVDTREARKAGVGGVLAADVAPVRPVKCLVGLFKPCRWAGVGEWVQRG